VKYGKGSKRKATSDTKDKNDTSFNRQLSLHDVKARITDYSTGSNQLANSTQSVEVIYSS